MAKRQLESNGCPKRTMETQSRLHFDQVELRRKVSKFSASPWMDRRISPILELPHDDRHLLHRTSLAPEAPVRGTVTLVCNDEDLQAGQMRARKDFKPTTQSLASLRQELGWQNSFIPKNERVRQRPVDETLRAELEWQSQNWKTCWSLPFSSSSSSQQWTRTSRSRLSMARTQRHSVARS